jgi:hypothetical protein
MLPATMSGRICRLAISSGQNGRTLDVFNFYMQIYLMQGG